MILSWSHWPTFKFWNIFIIPGRCLVPHNHHFPLLSHTLVFKQSLTYYVRLEISLFWSLVTSVSIVFLGLDTVLKQVPVLRFFFIHQTIFHSIGYSVF